MIMKIKKKKKMMMMEKKKKEEKEETNSFWHGKPGNMWESLRHPFFFVTDICFLLPGLCT